MNADAKIFTALKFIQNTFTRNITSFKKDEDRPVISIYFDIGINLNNFITQRKILKRELIC